MVGCYINPKSGTKEQWLAENANPVGRVTVANQPDVIPAYEFFAAGTMPVVLVDNGRFTAAAVAYCPQEYDEFVDLSDGRPRLIFQAKIDDIRPVSNLNDYVKIEPTLT